MPTVTNNGPLKRAADFRARMRAAGLVQVTGWVHKQQEADAIEMLKRLKRHPYAIPGPLIDPATGRYVKSKL